MKIKKVTRYYCDFCRRGSFKKPTMEKHERGCTANPNRHCSICELMRTKQQPTKILSMTLVEGGMGALRDLTDNCPCCILTAIRMQDRYSMAWLHEDFQFDFHAEIKSFWDDYNQDKMYPYG